MTTPRRLLFTTLALFAACLFAIGCGDDEAQDTGGAGTTTETTATEPAPAAGTIASNPDNAKITITVGSKNFTEQKILGEVFAQGLAAAGYTVETDLNLGDSDTALKAIKGGEIDAYPEYTGTALLTFFDVKANAIPKDPTQAFEDARVGFEKEGLVAFDETPFTSSNEVAVTKETAEKLGITKISELAEHDQDLTLYGSPECRKRTDCLLGLEEVYGLKFKKFVPVDIAQRHEVLKSGRADVSIVFTTDPQNAREGFVLLVDDEKMFPPYNSTLVVTQAIADAAGADLATTIDMIQQGLTNEAMQELNARADLDKQDIKEVAAAYLKESGLTE